MNVDIAKRLVDRRRAAGLTQEGLAEKLDVTRQAVSKWERSESSPDTDNLIALAELYGVSLDELLYQDVPENGASEPPAEEAIFEEATFTEACAPEPDPQDPSADNAADSSQEGSTGWGFDGSDGKVHIGPDGIHADDGGDYVHISWQDGVNVKDGKKGDQVHVGWDGIHVNGTDYGTFEEANEALGIHPHGPGRSSKAWRRFPFPLFVIVAYILAGVLAGLWGPALFLFFLIPLYYMVGGLVASKRLGPFLAGLYPLGSLAWFCWMAFMQNAPHPAWVIFLTIPLVEWAIAATSRWWRKRKKEREAVTSF